MSTDINSTQKHQPQWHEKLVASLEECERYDRSESPVKGCLGLIFLFIVLPGLMFWLAGLWTDGFRESMPPGLVILLVCGCLLVSRVFVVYPLVRYFIRRSKASMRNSALEEVLNQSKRRPVLYLRSFTMDEELSRIHWFHKYFGNGYGALFAESKEEQLVSQLFSYGPVIGIGKPDEDFPELGAARFYASNEIWQQKILDVVGVAQLVVWMTGTTEGLEWEIRTLTKSLEPSMLLVVCHPQLLSRSKAEKEVEWKRFVDKMGKHFPCPFPETLGETRFFVFDEKWQPISVSGPKQQVVMKDALEQLQETSELNAPKKPLGCHVLILPTLCPFLTAIIGATIGGVTTGMPGPAFIGGSVGFILGFLLAVVYIRKRAKSWEES